MASKLAAELFTDTNDTTSSNSRAVLSKSFVIARTNTVSTEYAKLPKSAYITGVRVNNTTAVASDAATTAVVNVYAGAGATLVQASDVKTAAHPVSRGCIALETAAAAAGNDIVIKAAYAETGAASTTGGPWLVSVEYVVG